MTLRPITLRDLEDALWRELDKVSPHGTLPARVELAIRDPASYGTPQNREGSGWGRPSRLSRDGLCWVLCPREHAKKLVYTTTLTVTPERVAVFATTQRYFPGDDLVLALGEAQ